MLDPLPVPQKEYRLCLRGRGHPLSIRFTQSPLDLVFVFLGRIQRVVDADRVPAAVHPQSDGQCLTLVSQHCRRRLRQPLLQSCYLRTGGIQLDLHLLLVQFGFPLLLLPKPEYLLINLSGRGDKDAPQVRDMLAARTASSH